VSKTKTKQEIITTTAHTENGCCAQQQSVWSFPILGPTCGGIWTKAVREAAAVCCLPDCLRLGRSTSGPSRLPIVANQPLLPLPPPGLRNRVSHSCSAGCCRQAGGCAPPPSVLVLSHSQIHNTANIICVLSSRRLFHHPFDSQLCSREAYPSIKQQPGDQ
jgi:hypothetical protein